LSPLYRIHSGGTMSVADSLGDAPHVTHYEVGHEIELDEAEAARLNENRTPENYRVVRVGGELETGAFKATQPPRSAEVLVSTPGVPGVDELLGAGHVLSEAEIEAARIKIEETPVDTRVTFMGDGPSEPGEPNDSDTSGVASAPGGLAIMQAIADLPPVHEENNSLADSAPDADAVSPTTAADDEAAPDWSTYLAAVSAAEAAKTIRDLESAEDVEAAIEAEEAKGGLKRPLVIRAGKAAIRRLHRV